MKKTILFLLILQGILMSAEIMHIETKGIKIPVIFEEDTNLPTFNLQLIFTNSGYMKDNKNPGLASMSAKLLNEGTKKLGSTKFSQKLENRAISLNTSNGFETFVMELSSLKSEAKTGLKLLQKLLEDPNYTKDTLSKIKTLRIGSLKRKENDFDYMSKGLLNKELFKNTPLSNSNSGTIDTINSLKLSDIKEFITTNLNLNNLIIVAGGDLDFKELKTVLKDLLNTITKGKKNSLKTYEISSTPTSKTVFKDTEQAYIYFGSKFNTTVENKFNYKAKVASFILGGSGFGSRLMEEIRVKRGLAYSAYGYISINKSHNYFTGYLQTKIDNASEAKDLVQVIVNEFIDNGVTQEELEAAKRFLSGSEPLRVETLSQRLNRSFHLHYKGLKQDFPQKELDLIESLELDDLNSYIKEHAELKELFFSIVTKKNKKD